MTGKTKTSSGKSIKLTEKFGGGTSIPSLSVYIENSQKISKRLSAEGSHTLTHTE